MVGVPGGQGLILPGTDGWPRRDCRVGGCARWKDCWGGRFRPDSWTVTAARVGFPPGTEVGHRIVLINGWRARWTRFDSTWNGWMAPEGLQGRWVCQVEGILHNGASKKSAKDKTQLNSLQ